MNLRGQFNFIWIFAILAGGTMRSKASRGFWGSVVRGLGRQPCCPTGSAWKNVKGQFNFIWIFAILAGGTILVLAIWGAVQTGDTLRFASDTEVGKSISIITDPLQAGFAEGSFGKILFRQETRLNNICLADGRFGKNDISIATRSGVGEEWNMAGGATSIHNKYIFSEEENVGRDYYVFSKPFEFPYEINDLIFLMSDRYCFLNAPNNIEDEILGLGIENIVLENCSIEDKVVCFGGPQAGMSSRQPGQECDSIVYGSCSGGCDSPYDPGVVFKSRGELEYVGSLMWGAIFSDSAVYTCNVERLMFRTGKTAEIFLEKARLMDARGCNTRMEGDLINWIGKVNVAGMDDLISIESLARELERKNNQEACGMW